MKYISKKKGKVLKVYYSSKELYEDLNAEQYLEMEDSDFEKYQKDWRDLELKNTDWIIPISDHSQREAYVLYRQKLRDWPATESFPDTCPSL